MSQNKIKEALGSIPKISGIYKLIAENGEVLYVGKAKNLKARVKQYINISKFPNRLQRMLMLVDKVECLTTNVESEALMLEASLIKSLKPKFNITLKDDKSFPYLALETDHDFPRIKKYRGKKKEGEVYFGPFSDVDKINKTIVELQKIFLIRSCSNNFFKTRSRPCLLYQIKRCSAPCVQEISKEQYEVLCTQLKDFLTEKSQKLQKILVKKMEEHSSLLQFEKAAEIRDRIRALTYVQSKNIFQYMDNESLDIFILYKQKDCSRYCIQIFFIREGQNYGNKSYFFDSIDGQDSEDILALFMIQFYKTSDMPKKIWSNVKLKKTTTIAQALKQISHRDVHIILNFRNNETNRRYYK